METYVFSIGQAYLTYFGVMTGYHFIWTYYLGYYHPLPMNQVFIGGAMVVMTCAFIWTRYSKYCKHLWKVFLSDKFCANFMLNDTIFLFLQNDKDRPRRRYQEEVWLLLVPNTCPNSQFLLVLLLRVSLGKHAPRLPMDSCTFPHLRSGQNCCQKINGWGWQPNGTTEQIPGNPILVYETRSLFGCHCWWCCNSSIFPMHHGYWLCQSYAIRMENCKKIQKGPQCWPRRYIHPL